MSASTLRDIAGRKSRQSETIVVSEMTLRGGEDLLDWLESQGCKLLRVDHSIEGFTIQFESPRGLQFAQAIQSGRARKMRITQIDAERNEPRTLASYDAYPCKHSSGFMLPPIPV